MLTWIHYCFCPHLLDAEPIPFSPLVLVNSATTIVIRVMFWLNIAIVNAKLELNSLKLILHLLL